MKPGTALEIGSAVRRALDLHHGRFPMDRLRGAAIIAEEAGEILKDAMEYTRPNRASEELLWQMKREVLDTAAACVLMIESINEYLVANNMRVKETGE